MPLFEFKCLECGENFEELLLSASDEVRCPACQSDDTERLISRFASSSSGHARDCAPGGFG